MINRHLTEHDLQAFRTRELEPESVERVVEHLEQCGDCASTWREQLLVARDVRALADDLVDSQHIPFDRLAAYVDGGLAPQQSREIDQHLAECPRCSEDLRDAREIESLIDRHRRNRRVRLLAAAAAVIVPVVGIFLWEGTRTHADAPAIHHHQQRSGILARRVVEPLVASALATGTLRPPDDLAELLSQPPVEVSRGPSGQPRFDYAPNREVVDSTRPRFSWRVGARGTSVVRVFWRDDEVVHSASLHETTWTPKGDLPRGRTYTWQVEITHAGTIDYFPTAPEPPATFIVLNEQEAQQIARAREASPPDHLLIGVLCASAGLRDEAERALRLASAQRGSDPRVARLISAIEKWSR